MGNEQQRRTIFFASLEREAQAWREGPGKDLLPPLADDQQVGNIVPTGQQKTTITDPSISTERIDPSDVAKQLGAEFAGQLPIRRRSVQGY